MSVADHTHRQQMTGLASLSVKFHAYSSSAETPSRTQSETINSAKKRSLKNFFQRNIQELFNIQN